jgi:hypothetical protein
VSEHHMQTQTHSLSSRTAVRAPLRYNKIGRMENFDDDLQTVLRTIMQRAARLRVAPVNVTLPRPLPFKHHDEQGAHLPRVNMFRNDTDVLRGIVQTFTQDFVCFGYSLPSELVAGI